MNLKERNEEMRAFFNEKAEGYDEVHLKMMANKAAIIDELPEGTAKILDLGAGTGLELIPLFERFPDARVTAVDIAEKPLQALKERHFARKVEVICGDFFSVDFGEDYDAVISSAALHHFDEQDKAALYAKAFACLRPGGIFVNSDRYVETQEEQDALFDALLSNTHGCRHWDTPLTLSNERRLLEGAGFVGFYTVDLGDALYKVMAARKPRP